MSNETLEAKGPQEGIVANVRAGKLYMFVAMVISGTIGYFVTQSGQMPFNVVLFRCLQRATVSSSHWRLLHSPGNSFALRRYVVAAVVCWPVHPCRAGR
ncbi:protein of unknown function [Burkholderia multivorans]